MYAALKSIGAYAPKRVLTNEDLEKLVDTSDEWIVKRTGIKERRVAEDNESTSDLGVKASLIAIERANIELSQIDAVICATLSPEYLTMPSTACLIAHKLGIKNVMAFDKFLIPSQDSADEKTISHANMGYCSVVLSTLLSCMSELNRSGQHRSCGK